MSTETLRSPGEAFGLQKTTRATDEIGRPPEHLPSLEPAAPTRQADAAGVRFKVYDFKKRSDRAAFIDMPHPIYKGDPNYIAPLRMHMMKFLDPSKNPAFKALEVHPIVAFRGNQPVARITAHIDRAYNTCHNSKTGFFGFFECINDRPIAHALLAEATQWLKNQGIEEIIGPMNFNTNHQIGLLVENFDRPPFIEETYNPRYYEELLTSFGFGKAKDLLVWWIDIQEGLNTDKRKRIARIAEKIRARDGIEVRHVNMRDLDREIGNIFKIYSSAWEKNWGFAPVSEEEFRWLAADFKHIAVPELVLFVEVKGRPVGFSMSLPNVNEVMPKNGRLFPFSWFKVLTQAKRTTHGRLVTLGTIPEYRKRGLESLMFVETILRGRQAGFIGGELGWTLEDNTLINRPIEALGGQIDRKYRLFGLKL